MPNKVLKANTAEKSTKYNTATAVSNGRVWSGSFPYNEKELWQLHILNWGPRSLEFIPFPWFKIVSIWCTSSHTAKAICLVKWGWEHWASLEARSSSGMFLSLMPAGWGKLLCPCSHWRLLAGKLIHLWDTSEQISRHTGAWHSFLFNAKMKKWIQFAKESCLNKSKQKTNFKGS